MEMHNFVKVHSTIAIARGIFQLCYGKLKVNIVKKQYGTDSVPSSSWKVMRGQPRMSCKVLISTVTN